MAANLKIFRKQGNERHTSGDAQKVMQLQGLVCCAVLQWTSLYVTSPLNRGRRKDMQVVFEGWGGGSEKPDKACGFSPKTANKAYQPPLLWKLSQIFLVILAVLFILYCSKTSTCFSHLQTPFPAPNIPSSPPSLRPACPDESKFSSSLRGISAERDLRTKFTVIDGYN